MNEIRLGTVGSGAIVHSVLDAVSMTDGIRLEAVYSRTREKGEYLAKEYGASKVYTDMEAFLADPEVNFVYIATPNLLHYEQVKKALLAGKNVICEKPFCTKASQARELVALAKGKGLFLVDAVPTAFLPNFESLKKALLKIGRVRLVMSNYSQYSSRYDLLVNGEVPNVLNPKLAGGCLMDINFYNVYLNVALFGKPDRAIYYPNMYQGLVDTSGIMILQYPDFVSESVGAKDTWGVNFVQIEGEKGYIYVKDGSNGLAQIRVVTESGEEILNRQEHKNRWLYEVQELTRTLLADDYENIYGKLEVMVDVVEVLEQSRKESGIIFPGDDDYQILKKRSSNSQG